MLRTILLIIIVLALLGSFPLYPYSSGWGYYPSGGLGLILIILIIWAVHGSRRLAIRTIPRGYLNRKPGKAQLVRLKLAATDATDLGASRIGRR